MSATPLKPDQSAYLIVRSDGAQAVVLGYGCWVEGDWFVITLDEDMMKPHRNSYVFRPIAAMELTAEQYEAGEWR